MLKKAILLILIILGCFSNSNAQYEQFYHEIGIMGGPTFLKSDFGERGDVENFTKNSGFSIGGFYYISAVENFHSLRENFKARIELSYSKSDLQHYGKYVDPELTSTFAKQLRAMKGKTTMVNAGFQVEFYPWKIDDYNRGGSNFSPYLSGGFQVSNYTSEVKSDLGKLGSPATTPRKYIGAYKNDDGIAFSLTAGFGTRYKIGDYHALIADFRAQYYFSDWIDGLNPNNKVYTENKSNDWSATINFGYVYYIN